MVFIMAESFYTRSRRPARGALLLCCERRIDSLILGVITLSGLMLKATSIMVALAGGNLIVGLPSWQWLHPSSESVYL